MEHARRLLDFISISWHDDDKPLLTEGEMGELHMHVAESRRQHYCESMYIPRRADGSDTVPSVPVEMLRFSPAFAWERAQGEGLRGVEARGRACAQISLHGTPWTRVPA